MGIFGGKSLSDTLLRGSEPGPGQPEPTGLTFQERAMAALAALNGDFNTAMQIKQLPALRAKKAAFMSQLTSAMGPQYADDPAPSVGGLTDPTTGQPQPSVMPQLPVRTSDGLNINDPRLAALALGAPEAGVNMTPMIDVMKAQQPTVDYVNGFRYNKKDLNSGPAFAPTLDKGQEPLFDANGRIAAIRNIDGSVRAAAEMASATEGAKAAAQAHYQLPSLSLPSGATQQVPGDIAPDILAKALGLLSNSSATPGTGGVSPAPSPLAGLGRSQSPAEKETAVGMAKMNVDRATLQPKETAALQDLDNRSGLTAQIIHQILGDSVDAKGNYVVGGGKSMVGPLTTNVLGGSAVMRNIYQPSHDLQAQIDHVKAMTALDELQKLREESPTGAGLGRVTQQEINLLAAMRGSIDQAQGGPQFEQNLRRQLHQLEAIRSIRQKQYQDTYGDQSQGASSASPSPASGINSIPLADRMAEARRRGLLK